MSWKSFNNIYSKQKSLSLNEFKKVINNDSFDFINLQYGNVEKELIKFNNSSNSIIHTLDNLDLFNDFVKIAGILKNIDLFITVSNSTAHLAGALGVKTLLIKPFNQATFHYWNQGSNRTTWYDSVEIIEREQIKDTEYFIKKIFSKFN